MTKLQTHATFETEIRNKLKELKFVPRGLEGGKNQARLNHNYFYLNAYFLAYTRSIYTTSIYTTYEIPIIAFPHTLTKNKPLK